MTRNQYIRKIIKEVVGSELSKVDTTSPGYIKFLHDHTHGLPPKEAADYEIFFREKLQFVADFKWCFLGVLMDYCSGRIDFPVGDVVRDLIGELVKTHYPTEYTMIINDKVCQGFILTYIGQFKKIIKDSKGFDFNTLRNSASTPVDNFAYVNGHQLVNVISLRLEAKEKKNEFVPLRLHPNEGDGEVSSTEDGEGLSDEDWMGLIAEEGEGSENNAGEEEDIHDNYAYIPRKPENRRTNNGAKWGCSLVILIALLLVVYFTTASLNPLAVFHTKNTLAKVSVSVLVGVLAILFLQMVSLSIKRHNPNYDPEFDIFGMRKSVEVGTGRSAEKAICPSCGLSVLLNNDTLGLPIVCHTCRVAWHDGPQCYRKGMPPSNEMIPAYPCPNCRSSDNSMADEK